MRVSGILFDYGNASWAEGWMGKIGFGFLTLVARLIITVVNHLGYPGFRNRKVIRSMPGNRIMTLAYIVTFNPLAVILLHMAMHVREMIHGRESTGLVPLHYKHKDL